MQDLEVSCGSQVQGFGFLLISSLTNLFVFFFWGGGGGGGVGGGGEAVHT